MSDDLPPSYDASQTRAQEGSGGRPTEALIAVDPGKADTVNLSRQGLAGVPIPLYSMGGIKTLNLSDNFINHLDDRLGYRFD